MHDSNILNNHRFVWSRTKLFVYFAIHREVSKRCCQHMLLQHDIANLQRYEDKYVPQTICYVHVRTISHIRRAIYHLGSEIAGTRAGLSTSARGFSIILNLWGFRGVGLRFRAVVYLLSQANEREPCHVDFDLSDPKEGNPPILNLYQLSCLIHLTLVY